VVSATEDPGRLEKLEDGYAEYEVHDSGGEKIGTVDASFADEDDRREYVAVKTGVAGVTPGLGTSLIPLEICAVDDTRRVIEVSQPKETVEKAPPIGDDMAFTPEYLAQLRGHYGL
jgi:hypothetical protein